MSFAGRRARRHKRSQLEEGTSGGANSARLSNQGNSLKLKSIRTHHNLRKYYFSIKIINIWKSLPEFVVAARPIIIVALKLDLINFGILKT